MDDRSTKQTRIGVTFSDDNDVTLFHGDCLEFLRSLPDRCAKLVITSPPYQVGKAYEERMSFDDYLERQRLAIAECVRVLRIGEAFAGKLGTTLTDTVRLFRLTLRCIRYSPPTHHCGCATESSGTSNMA
jgi:DNA modification methylase